MHDTTPKDLIYILLLNFGGLPDLVSCAGENGKENPTWHLRFKKRDTINLRGKTIQNKAC